MGLFLWGRMNIDRLIDVATRRLRGSPVSRGVIWRLLGLHDWGIQMAGWPSRYQPDPRNEILRKMSFEKRDYIHVHVHCSSSACMPAMWVKWLVDFCPTSSTYALRAPLWGSFFLCLTWQTRVGVAVLRIVVYLFQPSPDVVDDVGKGRNGAGRPVSGSLS